MLWPLSMNILNKNCITNKAWNQCCRAEEDIMWRSEWARFHISLDGQYIIFYGTTTRQVTTPDGDEHHCPYGDLLKQVRAHHTMLRDILHRLPVTHRIQLKIAFLAFTCIRGAGPAYFQHVCVLMVNLSGRAGLRSAEHGDLAVSRRTTEHRKRSFSVATPVTWNSLPEHLHSSSISKGQFRRGLKLN